MPSGPVLYKNMLVRALFLSPQAEDFIHLQSISPIQFQTHSGSLDTQGELDTDIDLARHLDHLRELHRLLRRALQVLDREDLEAGLVDLKG